MITKIMQFSNWKMETLNGYKGNIIFKSLKFDFFISLKEVIWFRPHHIWNQFYASKRLRAIKCLVLNVFQMKVYNSPAVMINTVFGSITWKLYEKFLTSKHFSWVTYHYGLTGFVLAFKAITKKQWFKKKIKWFYMREFMGLLWV